MTVAELIEHLKAIVAVHPEADEAQVWAYDDVHDHKFPVKAVGWDTKHRPKRIKLE